MWLGLVWYSLLVTIVTKVFISQGTGLLRVYDSEHYFLESDTKITDTRQRTGARLVCFNTPHNHFYFFVCSLPFFLLISMYGRAHSTRQFIFLTQTPAQVCCTYMGNGSGMPLKVSLGMEWGHTITIPCVWYTSRINTLGCMTTVLMILLSITTDVLE